MSKQEVLQLSKNLQVIEKIFLKKKPQLICANKVFKMACGNFLKIKGSQYI